MDTKYYCLVEIQSHCSGHEESSYSAVLYVEHNNYKVIRPLFKSKEEAEIYAKNITWPELKPMELTLQ